MAPPIEAIFRSIQVSNSSLRGEWDNLNSYLKPLLSLGDIPSFVTAANAADQNDPNTRFQSNLRSIAYAGMIVVLAVVMVICLIAVFLTKDEKRFSFAVDTIKTLMGFFIGVISTLFGLPAS
ncbi:hypothetical protein [Mesorhizobium huakuii]|uniref:Uncharacterized protein n=1 Tax=Mesorhizobium huakuii TaxID=28104 RepID=A0A7G6SQ17_9HYPH|nr:hypothetical protein [Mesorhizobium huakuii]QND56599.1 hypothetical protein HB778_08230 [Mesorhizobium huakuii]